MIIFAPRLCPNAHGASKVAYTHGIYQMFGNARANLLIHTKMRAVSLRLQAVNIATRITMTIREYKSSLF